MCFYEGNIKEYFKEMNFDEYEKNSRKHYIICNGIVDYDIGLKYVKSMLSKDEKYTNYIVCGSIQDRVIWNDIADELKIKSIPLYKISNNEYILDKKSIPKQFNLIATNQRIIDDLIEQGYYNRIKENIINI